MISLGVMRYREVKGHWPLMKAKNSVGPVEQTSKPDEVQHGPNKSES